MKRLIIIMVTAVLTVNATMISQLAAEVKKQEGYSKYLYIDNGGYSIGYGTNVTDGLSKVEANWLLIHRLYVARKKLERFGWYRVQNRTRKMALIDLTYNLGISRLLRFRDFIWCLSHGYFHAAANQLKSSLWFSQVGRRGRKIYTMIYFG